MSREPTWFVDTNILVHVLKRSPLGEHLIEAGQFRNRPSTPMMCVVSEAELLALAANNRWGQQMRERLEELLNELVIVDVRADARALLNRYAALDVFSHSQGKKWARTISGSPLRPLRATRSCSRPTTTSITSRRPS